MQLKKRWETKVMKVSDIKFDTKNPNVFTAKQEAALGKSLERFGYVYEIVVDKKTGRIADGHHRAKELIKQGAQEIEVKVIDFKNDEERRLFRQVTKKVQGVHSNEVLEAEEMKVLLEEYDMEEFSDMLATSEQEILNILNKSNEELNKDLENAQEVEQLGLLLITCPFCKKKFKKAEQ